MPRLSPVLTLVHPTSGEKRTVATEADAVKLEWEGYIREEYTDAARPSASKPKPPSGSTSS